MNTLLYLADESSSDGNRSTKFMKVSSSVVKNIFKPSSSHSINEQIGVLLNTLGWKNSEIRLMSSTRSKIILGSNRYLDQNNNTLKGLNILVKMIALAVGYHIFDREVDAFVEIDINGPVYTIDIQTITTLETSIKEKEIAKTIETTSETPSQRGQIPAKSPASLSTFDTNQIFLPVLSNKLPLVQLNKILLDVLSEFAVSWYGETPMDSELTEDTKTNLIMVIEFLTQKATETNTTWVDLGNQVGGYFAGVLKKSFTDDLDLIGPEIKDGAQLGSVIRDIKARSLCSLTVGSTCGSNIGGRDRSFCDFVMGLWAGTLSQLTEFEYKFTGFYATGKRSTDPCLMEFELK
jgi:hypothetical protein